MIKLANNVAKNRLLLRLSGTATFEETQEAAKRVKALALQLKPGFDIINDISQFMPSDPRVQKAFMDVQQFVMTLGAKRVVRVVSNVLGNNQFRRLHQEAGVSYTVIEIGTYEEAVKYLDENPK